MIVLGVDGGNTKTELVAATVAGDLLAYVRGPGSNSHGPRGAEGTADVVAALARDAASQPTSCNVALELPAEVGVFYLCGADVPSDIAALEDALGRRNVARRVVVDNDTFAILRAGTAAADAIAVVCGAGINVVGRAAGGREARYPSLGWETGDWGGSEMLGREALFHAARAEDGRGEETVLVRLLREHFHLPSVEEIGKAIHYRTIREARLGDVAPAIVAAAADGDGVARRLVERLAEEIALLVRRALRDLALTEADVVLGGGMLRGGRDVLREEVLARLPQGARPIVLTEPPVLGAVLAALELVDASDSALARLRETLSNAATASVDALAETRHGFRGSPCKEPAERVGQKDGAARAVGERDEARKGSDDTAG